MDKGVDTHQKIVLLLLTAYAAAFESQQIHNSETLKPNKMKLCSPTKRFFDLFYQPFREDWVTKPEPCRLGDFFLNSLIC